MAKHLVIYRLSAMGDVAMLVPILLALQKQNENLKITIVSNSFFFPIFKSIKHINFIGIDTQKKHQGFLGNLKIFREVYQAKPTHFADLHESLRSRIVRFLLRLLFVKISVLKKGRKEKKALVRATNKIFKPLKHTIERYAEVLRKLGFEIDLQEPNYLEKTNIPAKYLELFNANQPKIGIAPFAKHEAKTYPFAKMKEVVRQLAEKNNSKIFLFGGKTEQKELQELKYNYKNVAVVNCSFEEELALISNLDVMLAMDSGNAHLAAIYGVKTITIWAGTHPFAGFLPYFQPLENCIVPQHELFPSLPNSVFGNQMNETVKLAFESIAPEKVVEKMG